MCFVSYSAPTAKFGSSLVMSVDLSLNMVSVIPVLRSLTVVKSSFIASPATASGAKFFLAEMEGGMEGGREGRREGEREEG